MSEELYLDVDGVLRIRKVPPKRHIIPPYTFEVVDHKGDTRPRSAVRHCSLCGLWWDSWEMVAPNKPYCRECWNNYTSWRRSVVNFANSTGTSQDWSVQAFREKYLSGTLTVSPPQQFDPSALDED